MNRLTEVIKMGQKMTNMQSQIASLRDDLKKRNSFVAVPAKKKKRLTYFYVVYGWSAEEANGTGCAVIPMAKAPIGRDNIAALLKKAKIAADKYNKKDNKVVVLNFIELRGYRD